MGVAPSYGLEAVLALAFGVHTLRVSVVKSHTGSSRFLEWLFQAPRLYCQARHLARGQRNCKDHNPLLGALTEALVVVVLGVDFEGHLQTALKVLDVEEVAELRVEQKVVPGVGMRAAQGSQRVEPAAYGLSRHLYTALLKQCRSRSLPHNLNLGHQPGVLRRLRCFQAQWVGELVAPLLEVAEEALGTRQLETLMACP